MADAEDEIVFGQRFVEQRAERGGIGGEADAEIDVRRDDAGQVGGGFGAGGEVGVEPFAARREKRQSGLAGSEG